MPLVGKSDSRSAATQTSCAPPLVTQFTRPPAPFALIDRPRLRERIQRGLRQPVTLVCGPAGAGKTALLSSALEAERERSVAWISLEPGDEQPSRFWTAVLTSLRLAGAMPSGSALESIAPPVPGSESAFMPLLVNALAELPEPAVLVLDDLHLLRSRECLQQLAFLLLHVPGTLNLVFSSRADPVLPLHLLRVRGQLTELRAADLAFTPAEAGELLRAHGLQLREDLVDALCARTEGWGAGLRLAALSLQGVEDPEPFVREFAGDDRAIGDYLLAEVLESQPPELRGFLLRTSIVDRVCGSLADALTGRDDGADALVELERTNGFVLGTDARREWFRYHGLFAKLLRTRAEREVADELPSLHRRAARWYADDGSESRALRHAIEGQDWDLAVEIVARHWFDLFIRGHGATIRSLVDTLPEQLLRDDAELAAALACAALDAGDAGAAVEHLARAEHAAGDLPESRRPAYEQTLALARLYRARLDGDVAAARHGAAALLGAAATSTAPADVARRALTHAVLGETLFWDGQLDAAADELRDAASLAGSVALEFVQLAVLSQLGLLDVLREGTANLQHARGAIELAGLRGWSAVPQTACAHAALALAAFFDLHVEEAGEHLERAAAAAGDGGSRPLDLIVALLAARLRGARGEADDALRALDGFDTAHRGGSPPPYEAAALASARARAHSLRGDGEAARAVLAPLLGKPWLEIDVALARLALADGEPAAAADVLERARAAGKRATHAGTAVELTVLLAIASDETGDAPGSAAALEQALDLAERGGHLWPFLEAGRRMQTLLRAQIRAGTHHRAIVGDLLEAFEDRLPERRPVAPLLEPLSDREHAVLRYLPTRLSNREIAAELFVTTNTVKTHLRSIYCKLDVSRRREAVERARDLRLLAGSRH